MSLAVLPNGYLVSGDYVGEIKIWNTDTGSVLKTLTGHSGWVSSIVVLPNGNLASGSIDRTIIIWSIGYSNDFTPATTSASTSLTPATIKSITITSTSTTLSTTLFTKTTTSYSNSCN